MTKAIDNSQDIIDSRGVIERIAELESDRDNLQNTIDEATEVRDEAKELCDVANPDALVFTRLDAAQETLDAANLALAKWLDEEDSQELKTLTALAEEAESYVRNWEDGETLIRDSYFETYAQELAEDIGAICKDQSWPNNFIDWVAAADALKQDYMSVDFNGEEYWVLSL